MPVQLSKANICWRGTSLSYFYNVYKKITVSAKFCRCNIFVSYFGFRIGHINNVIINGINYFSAGVGRTGTYIALDALYREGQNTGIINVPMYVNTMRKDRMNMIQGEVSRLQIKSN